jgi:hypothetical protein
MLKKMITAKLEHVTKEGRLTLDDILDPKGHSHKHIHLQDRMYNLQPSMGKSRPMYHPVHLGRFLK